MAEEIECEQSGSNTFLRETDSETVEKEIVDVGEAANDTNSSTASIAYGKDENVSNIQVEAIMTAAESMENSVVSTVIVKKSIPSTSAALNCTSETDGGEGTSGCVSNPGSRTVAYVVKKSSPSTSAALNCTSETDGGEGTSSAVSNPGSDTMVFKVDICEYARQFPERAQDLLETVNISTSKLMSHMELFQFKVKKRGRMHCVTAKDFYDNIVSEYSLCLDDIYGDLRSGEDKMKSFTEAANTCYTFAENVAKMLQQATLDETTRRRFSEEIKGFLAKQNCFIINLEKLWTKVKKDLKNEEKERREARNCKICTFIFILSATILLYLLGFISIGYYAAAIAGVLATGWCAVYLLYDFYQYLYNLCNPKTEDKWLEISYAQEILDKCMQRRWHAKSDVKIYSALFPSDETDDRNLETESSTADAYESERLPFDIQKNDLKHSASNLDEGDDRNFDSTESGSTYYECKSDFLQ